MGWPIGELILAAEAYFIRDHYTLQLVSHAPMFLVLIVIAIGIPESTRWLISKKRHEGAKKEILKIAAINRTTIPEQALANDSFPMANTGISVILGGNIVGGKLSSCA